MPGPSNFISFADYLGINEEAGQQMAERTLENSNGGMTPQQMQEMAEKHYASARNAGDSDKDGGVYKNTYETTQQGLASYSAFMKGMNDPAARRATMEKAYGNGAVSWLD